MFSREAIAALKAARSVFVLTGAGVSADSGVPTFRGTGGLWRNYQATSLATPKAFANNPKLVWEFYSYRRKILAPLKPNPGHFAIASLEERVSSFTLATQNIDNLHRIAGSQNIIELHGNIWEVRCSSSTCKNAAEPWENCQVPLSPLPPLCGDCGGHLRPNVVWFGEMLNPAALSASMRAIQEADFFIVVGTSALVQPASRMPLMAHEAGVFVLEINPEPTELSKIVKESVQETSGAALPLLVEEAFAVQ